MTKEETPINLRIKDSLQFYANETTINFGPVEFILDFKCGTHVQETQTMRSVLVSHDVVILTPYHYPFNYCLSTDSFHAKPASI